MTLSTTLAIAMATLAGGSAAPIQHPHITVKEEKPGLLAQARISGDSAYALATKRVPGGRASETELEMEKGVLVYSFDLRIAGKPGVEEVHVDAKTGKILSVAHETPAAEAKEAKASKKPHGG